MDSHRSNATTLQPVLSGQANRTNGSSTSVVNRQFVLGDDKDDDDIPSDWKETCKKSGKKCLKIIRKMIQKDKWQDNFPDATTLDPSKGKKLCTDVPKKYATLCHDNIGKGMLYLELYRQASAPPFHFKRGGNGSKGMSTWQLTALIIGLFIFLLIIGILLYWCFFASKRSGGRHWRAAGSSKSKSRRSGLKSRSHKSSHRVKSHRSKSRHSKGRSSRKSGKSKRSKSKR